MSSGLPVISGKEAVKAFEKAGWKFVRIGSSRHMIMKWEIVKTRYSHLPKFGGLPGLQLLPLSPSEGDKGGGLGQ